MGLTKVCLGELIELTTETNNRLIYGPEDVMGMKEDRVMLLPQDSDAKFITKQVDVNYIESQKERLVEDIHKFSKCPNLSDAQFASNASGVAMSYKIMGTETLAGIKERKFKKSHSVLSQ